MKKFKEKVANLKGKVAVGLAVGSTGVMMAVPAYAETTSTSDILQSGVNTIKTDVLGYIAIILPVGLGIFGAIWGIKKAISFFKGVAK